MIKTFSIKSKLILAFSSISILLIIYSLYTITSINKSSNHFSDYREIARSSVILGRIQANMLMVRLCVKDYIKTNSIDEIEKFNLYFSRTNRFIDEADDLIRNKKRVDKLQDIKINLNIYKTNFEKVINLVEQRNDIVKNSLDIDGKRIEQLLTSVMNSAEKDNDIIASLKTAKGIRTLLLARLYTSKFLITNSKNDLKRVEQEFQNLEKELADIKSNIQNSNRIKKLLSSIKLINSYIVNVNSIRHIILTRNEIINNELNKLGPYIAKNVEEIKLSLKNEQDKIGPTINNNNELLLNTTIIVSGIIILFAILISFIITRGITRSLKDFEEGLLNFFGYLNKDIKEFKYIKTNTNDEIAEMSKIVNDNIEKTTQLLINEERNQKIIANQSKISFNG